MTKTHKFDILQEDIDEVKQKTRKVLEENYENLEVSGNYSFEEFKKTYQTFIRFTWADTNHSKVRAAINSLDRHVQLWNDQEKRDEQIAALFAQRLKNRKNPSDYQDAAAALQLYALDHPAYSMEDAKMAKKFLKTNYDDPHVHLRLPSLHT